MLYAWLVHSHTNTMGNRIVNCLRAPWSYAALGAVSSADRQIQRLDDDIKHTEQKELAKISVHQEAVESLDCAIDSLTDRAAGRAPTFAERSALGGLMRKKKSHQRSLGLAQAEVNRCMAALDILEQEKDNCDVTSRWEKIGKRMAKINVTSGGHKAQMQKAQTATKDFAMIQDMQQMVTKDRESLDDVLSDNADEDEDEEEEDATSVMRASDLAIMRMFEAKSEQRTQSLMLDMPSPPTSPPTTFALLSPHAEGSTRSLKVPLGME